LLSQKQQLQELLEATQQCLVEATIHQEFDLKVQNLLHKIPSTFNIPHLLKGFTLASVLALPLSDQQL